MKHGVYQIRNAKNGKRYIGSSINIDARWRGHRSDLRYNRHHASRLQLDWNKYGAGVFIFEILEQCHPDILEEREQYYLDALLFAQFKDLRFYRLGYNNSRDASYKTVTDETRAKQSRAARARSKPSNKTRRRMSIAQQGKRLGELSSTAKLSTKNVEQILHMAINGIPDKQIAVMFNTPYKTINNIVNGRTWPHIKLCEKEQMRLDEIRSSNRNKINCRQSGENNGRSKLTISAVWNIKDQITSGFSNTEIAQRHGVSSSTISLIRRGKTWTDV